MAVIIPFKKPEERTEPNNVDSLTKKEFHDRVQEETLFRCRTLLHYYKSTGYWTDESCERAMVEAVQALKKVCITLAENKDKKPNVEATIETPTAS